MASCSHSIGVQFGDRFVVASAGGGGEVEREVERDAWTVVKLASLSGLSVF